MIGPEIADLDKAIVGRDGGGVGVRNVLAGRVRAQCAELLMVLEIDPVDRMAERAVGLDAVGGDARAKIIGDERGVSSGVDRDIGGACSAGRHLARLVERAGLQVNDKGGSRCGGVIHRVDSVKGTSRLAGGSNRQEGWAGRRGGEDRGSQLAFGGIKVRLVDPLADIFAGICADVDDERWRRGNRFLLLQMPSALGMRRGRKRREDDEESTTGEHGPIPWETMLVRLEGGSPSRLLAGCLG